MQQPYLQNIKKKKRNSSIKSPQYFNLNNQKMFKEVIVFTLIAAFLGLSQTAGVSGGPIVNICLMISMGYDAKLSISITFIFIIGGSIASIWKNSQKKNPKTGKSMVNLDLVYLTIPTMSTGSLFGGVIKNFLSEAIITLLFILLFLFLAYDLRKTLQKCRAQDQTPHPAPQKSKIENLQIKQSIELTNFLQKQLKQNPTDKLPSKLKLTVRLAITYYLITVIVSLARGGLHYDSIIGINPCGFVGWMFLFGHFALSFFVASRLGKEIHEGYENSLQTTLIDKNGKNVSKQIINQDTVQYFIIAGFFAGLVGATLAIGGAFILIPVWLKLGVDKDIAASSTATLILMSSLVAFTIASFNQVYKQISILIMIFYLLLAFAGAAIVKDFFGYLTTKYHLKTLVVTLLLLVAILSLIVLVPFQAFKMYNNFDGFVQFGQLC